MGPHGKLPEKVERTGVYPKAPFGERGESWHNEYFGITGAALP